MEIVNGAWKVAPLDGVEVKDLKEMAFAMCPWAYVIWPLVKEMATPQFLAKQMWHSNRIKHYKQVLDTNVKESTFIEAYDQLVRYAIPLSFPPFLFSSPPAGSRGIARETRGRPAGVKFYRGFPAGLLRTPAGLPRDSRGSPAYSRETPPQCIYF